MRELVPVADVADEIINSYVHRLIELIDEDLLSSVWYRVTPGRSRTSLELNEVVQVEPIFEVLIIVNDASPSLSRAMSEAAASMQSSIVIMPEAAMIEEWSDAELKRGDWKHVALPSSFGRQRLAGV